MNLPRPLVAFATRLLKLSACSALVLLAQLASVVDTRAQTPITLQGRVVYQFPDNSNQGG